MHVVLEVVVLQDTDYLLAKHQGCFQRKPLSAGLVQLFHALSQLFHHYEIEVLLLPAPT